MLDRTIIQRRFELLRYAMDEPMRRLWAAAEAQVVGRGGISLVAAATGMSRNTIRAGLRELEELPAAPSAERLRARLRRPGAGRKLLVREDSSLLPALEALLEPLGGSNPSLLRWTCKSTRRLAADLKRQGHRVGPRKVAELLRNLRYRLEAKRPHREGTFHPYRNAQFGYINELAQIFYHSRQPVLSVEIKKEEALPVRDSQSGTESLPALGDRHEWAGVAPDRDSALLAGEVLQRWWRRLGPVLCASPRQVLLLSDTGCKDECFAQPWKEALQRWADETGLRVVVCYFPPGTSKWRKLTLQMTSQFLQSLPGRRPVQHRAFVYVIGDALGLRGTPEWEPFRADSTISPGREDIELRLEPPKFPRDWNYILVPRTQST